MLELAGIRARVGEDSSTVTVGVVVDDFDSIIQSLSLETDKDGTKDFFLVAFHVSSDIGNDSGT